MVTGEVISKMHVQMHMYHTGTCTIQVHVRYRYMYDTHTVEQLNAEHLAHILCIVQP